MQLHANRCACSAAGMMRRIPLRWGTAAPLQVKSEATRAGSVLWSRVGATQTPSAIKFASVRNKLTESECLSRP